MSALAPGVIGPGLALRAAIADDFEPLFACHEQAFCAHIVQLWGWDDAWQRRDFARLFAALSPLIVESGGTACGYLQVQQRAEALHLVNIALRPEARGQGIGGQLMSRLMRDARAQELDVTLAVFRTNRRAGAFYSRLGFMVEHTTTTHEHRRWSFATALPRA